MGIGKIPLSVYKSNKILDDAKFLTMNILRIRGTRITGTVSQGRGKRITGTGKLIRFFNFLL